MTSDRIKELQDETAYPKSRSVRQALLQVWNECQQEQNKKLQDLIRKIEIHVETTEECMENTSLPEYVSELLNADNKLFKKIIETLKQ